MMRPAIALCLLVQVSAAEPTITATARGGATYTDHLEERGGGFQLAVGLGVAPTRDTVLGLEAMGADYRAAYAPGQTIAHGARGLYVLAARRVAGPAWVGLALGMVRSSSTRTFADGTPSEPWNEPEWDVSARIYVAVTVATLEQHSIELIGSAERTATPDPTTTFFIGAGYRFTGGR